jgi:hypothetical protein
MDLKKFGVDRFTHKTSKSGSFWIFQSLGEEQHFSQTLETARNGSGRKLDTTTTTTKFLPVTNSG